jgi:membrane protein
VTFLDKIFLIDVKGAPRFKRYPVRVGQFLVGLYNEFNQDKCQVRAQGLTYASLLAMVPLVAIMFAMFSAFPAFESTKAKVQELIFSQFMPSSHEQIINYIDQFAANADKLGIIGMLLFLYGAITMLDNIEKTFNEIWAVTKKRAFFSKLTSYTTLLVFGTVLLGAGFSITAKIKAMLKLDSVLQIGFIDKMNLLLMPFFTSFLVFLLMYKVIPNTKVKLKSAAFGAFFGALFFELSKSLITNSVSTSVKYSKIYGAMATVPIFLIGLFIMWMLILIGLEITYTHQNFKAMIRNRIFKTPTGRDRLSLALKFFSFIASKFHKGETPPDSMALADRFEVPLELAENFSTMLIERNLILEVTGENDGLVPSVSLDSITLKQVVDTLFVEKRDRKVPPEALEENAENTITLFQEAGYKSLGDRPFLDYLKKVQV